MKGGLLVLVLLFILISVVSVQATYPDCNGDDVDGDWTVTNSSSVIADVHCNTIVVASGGSIVVNSVGNGSSISINATNISVGVGGTINSNSKGCPSSQSGSSGSCVNEGGGVGSGEGEDGAIGQGGAGGGYGGAGGTNSNDNKDGGISYGSALVPVLLGSGGGTADDDGGVGGGAVKINATDTLNVSGTIVANGGVGTTEWGDGSGGGSGGSVLVYTNSLIGSGSFSANGGNGADDTSTDGGGGSGGRIVVYYNSSTLTDMSSSSASGGSGPGAATDGDSGTLGFIDMDDNILVIYGGWEFQENANYSNITTYSSLVRINTSSVTVNVTDLFTPEYMRVTCLSTSFDLSINVANDANFSDVSIKNWGYNGVDCDLVDLNASSNTQGSYENFVVEANNNVTLSFGLSMILSSSTITLNNALDWIILNGNYELTLLSSSVTGNLDWILPNFTIDSGSSMSANSRGCLSSQSGSEMTCTNQGAGVGYGEGADGAIGQGGGGAGYGGKGGRNSNDNRDGGSAHGNVLAPVLLGSGGGTADDNGGVGGGVVKINVTNIFNNSGSITTTGGTGTTGFGDGSGGGSGGSIYVTTNSLIGSGSFSANGGNGADTSTDGGGGSGGRIAIYYSSGSNSISRTAPGGNGPGAATNGDSGSAFTCSSLDGVSCRSSDPDLVLTNGTIVLKSNYSINYSQKVNRTVIGNWKAGYIAWNDSATNSTTIAWYNLTGLNADTEYTITDNAAADPNSPLTTDADGNLPLFNVSLSSEHAIVLQSNTAPAVSNSNVTSSDSSNYSNGTLTGNWMQTDDDADEIIDNETKWWKGPALNTTFANFTIIESANLTKGDVWNFSVRVYDGTDWSAWGTNVSITIVNRVPTVDTLNITSSSSFNYSNGTLTGNWNQSDEDNEAVTSNNTRWWKGSVLNTTFANFTSIESANLTKGEVWNFSVRVYDGVDWGSWSDNATITVANRVPTVNISMGSTSTTNYSTGDLFVNWTFSDDDSDTETDNETKWTKDGVNQSLNNNSMIDSGNLTALEVWNVSVRVYDGTDWSDWSANKSVTIVAVPVAEEESSSSSSSSSSEGNAIRSANKFNLIVTDEETDSTFMEDDEVVLDVNGEEFEIEFEEVNSEKILIYLVGEDITIAVYEGHKSKVDLNWDGDYDIFITLVSLDSGEAVVSFQLYSESEDVDVEEAIIEEVEVEEEVMVEEDSILTKVVDFVLDPFGGKVGELYSDYYLPLYKNIVFGASYWIYEVVMLFL